MLAGVYCVEALVGSYINEYCIPVYGAWQYLLDLADLLE
jgi:hypothetical protein